MLEIINTLEPFFEDCYERINIRKYSRLVSISPPTASKVLNLCKKNGLLEKTEYERYLFFNANRESRDFIDLSRIYWRNKLKDLIRFVVEKSVIEPVIVLFGSLSKAEAKKSSDVDIAIITSDNSEKDIPIAAELSVLEQKIGRRIEIFRFKSLLDASKSPIWKALLNGYILTGIL